MSNKKFSDLVTVRFEPGRATMSGIVPPRVKLAIADANDGKIAIEGSAGYTSSLEQIQELMRQTGMSNDKQDHMLLGAGVREPIRILARYKAWTQIFFADFPVDWSPEGGEGDNKIPVDQPIGTAFYSSVEGRPMPITTGVQQWVRPAFTETTTSVRIYWNTLKTAGWPILSRRLEEASDDMARKIDAKGKPFLDTAVAAVSGHSVSVATTMAKSTIDALIVAAAQIGFPITQGAINPGRLMDMTGWTNGSTNALPYFWSPESAREQVYRQLWADGYGNIRWFVSHSVPMSTVYLSGEPEEIGYHQHHGQAQSASDVDIDERVDKHNVWQDDAWYVGNNYNVWKITIT